MKAAGSVMKAAGSVMKAAGSVMKAAGSVTKAAGSAHCLIKNITRRSGCLTWNGTQLAMPTWCLLEQGDIMKSTMSHATRAELNAVIRSRYSKSSGKAKRKILDEFIAATGYHEKSAIRVLNSDPSSKVRQTRQRPSFYDESARAALIVLWEASDRVCGKRLKALVPILLPALERNGHLKLQEEIRMKVQSMSAALSQSINWTENRPSGQSPVKLYASLRSRIAPILTFLTRDVADAAASIM